MLEDYSTAHLRARRIRASDLNYVLFTDSDPMIQRWIYTGQPSRYESEERLQRWLREEREADLGFWIFSLAHDDIGHGGLFRSTRVRGEIELGYALRPPFWDQGYATEIAQSLIDIVARGLQLPRLIAITRPDNTASQRVLEKCGFIAAGDQINPDGTPSLRFELELT